MLPPQVEGALRPAPAAGAPVRLHMAIAGAVQGVGFRPAVYRLAAELGLGGWVSNGRAGVQIEVEGPPAAVEAFATLLAQAPPPLAQIRTIARSWVACQGATHFTIRASDEAGAATALLLPDVATCPDCLADIQREGDRRYGYAFTNCTNCGPRFSIIEALPYDRAHTTMHAFALCPHCAGEYASPADRRFHAQPTACPACGPTLCFVTRTPAGAWRSAAQGDEALTSAARALCAGAIVAVKGLGGFQLMVDAANEAAVARLRVRKAREEKPFALMARNLDEARTLIEADDACAALLTSPAAPIVLAPRAAGAHVASGVAPGNPWLGVMLAYTPLHHLLLAQCKRPLVATSGNRSDEPICIDNDEALDALGEIADCFLLHNRPIARPVDDSIATLLDGAPRILRRARGYAPLPMQLRAEGPEGLGAPTLLAVGGHLKNTVALAIGREVFVSQHIGDLASPKAQAACVRVIADFVRMYAAQPVAIAHDLHPDYASTQWAQRTAAQGAGALPAGLPLLGVQHHHAHLAACLAENQHTGPALGVIWDGSGFGLDGTVWGGEFLLGDAASFRRVAHLRSLRLPGGEAAVREPRRSALALLWEMGLESPPHAHDDFSERERTLLLHMLARGINAPVTTSAGRLFDALAALLGLCRRSSFEGQAAMALEQAADPAERGAYAPSLIPVPDGPLLLDWEPLVRAALADKTRGVAIGIISARAQRGLAQAIAAVAAHVGCESVALSGGCFQNRLLVTWTAEALRARGLRVLLHSQTPPNDGCIALGQIAVARCQLQHPYADCADSTDRSS